MNRAGMYKRSTAISYYIAYISCFVFLIGVISQPCVFAQSMGGGMMGMGRGIHLLITEAPVGTSALSLLCLGQY